MLCLADSDSTCFSNPEAQRIDQALQDANLKEVRYAAAIVAKDKELDACHSYAAHADSSYADCNLRAAMLGNAHEQDRKDIADLTLKVDKRGNTIKALVILSAVLLSLQILGR
jgi:hypothetical protein